MNDKESELTFKSLFIPFTKLKAVLILIVTGAAIFLNSIFNPFVYDDIQNIVVSPYVRNLANIPSFFYSGLAYPGNPFLQFTNVFYLPLLFTIYTLLISIFGINPLLFHLLQIFLHVICSVLLFIIFAKFFKRPLALFLSLIFLIHPINSEAVIYIAALQYPLLTVFGLIALYLLIAKENVMLNNKYLLLFGGMIFACLLSKETGILFIIILILYLLLFSQKNIKQVISTLAIILIPYLILKFTATNHILWTIFPSPIHRADLLARLISMPKIGMYYIYKFFIPVNFSIGQRWLVKQTDLQNFYIPLFIDILFIFLIIVYGVYLYKKRNKILKLYIFFIFWFCLGIIVVLQITPLDVTVADRWFYFPIIGLLGATGIILSEFIAYFKNNKIAINLIPIVAIILVFLLSILTVIRNSQWQTPFTLYSHDARYAGESAEIEGYLGEIYAKNGQLNEAKNHFEKAIIFDPMGDSLNGLAYTYEQKGNYTKAKELYWKNIQLMNGLPKYISFEGLSRIALIYEHNPKEANRLCADALKKYPHDELLIKFLAISQYFLGNNTQALETFKKVLNTTNNQENQQIFIMMKNNKLTF
jgi:protein O-mannosyl-transferase